MREAGCYAARTRVKKVATFVFEVVGACRQSRRPAGDFVDGGAARLTAFSTELISTDARAVWPAAV